MKCPQRTKTVGAVRPLERGLQGLERGALEAAAQGCSRNLPENRERRRRVVGPEKDPRETDEVERDQHGPQPAQPGSDGPATAVTGVPLFNPLRIEQKVQPVQRPPDYKGPVGAMPEAADHEHEKRVQSCPPRAEPVAAQRNIEVLAEPSGEGDMPPAPEILDVRGEVGIGEVPRHVQREQPGASDSDIRIAAEVTVDLEGEEVGGPEQLPAGRLGHVAVSLRHVEPQVIGNDHLLEEPPQHLPQPVNCVVPVEAPPLVELDEQVRRLLDRPGDHMREEGDEAEILHGVIDGAYAAAVDVDGVTQRLERVERDANGEDHAEDEEIGLEAGEAQQIMHNWLRILSIRLSSCGVWSNPILQRTSPFFP